MHTLRFLVLLLATSCHCAQGHAHLQNRHLMGYDAWITTRACLELPTVSNSQKDGMGRLWGYADGSSCTFKDEQQQALYPDVVTTPQDWASVPACQEAPVPDNSAADKSNRLWGVWWGKSCAFKTADGEPLYYDSYQGPLAGKKPPPAPVPAAAPEPTNVAPAAPASQGNASKPQSNVQPAGPRLAVLPSPSPIRSRLTASPSRPARSASDSLMQLPRPILRMPLPMPPPMADAAPVNVTPPTAAAAAPVNVTRSPDAIGSPGPAPAPAPVATMTSRAGACNCPDTVNATVDVERIVALVADQLWQRLANASNGYEGGKAAPLDTPLLNTSAGVQQQQQEVLRLSAVLEAIDALAHGAVPFSDDLVQAAKGSSTQTVQRPADQIRASEEDELQAPPTRPSDDLHILNDRSQPADSTPPAGIPPNYRR